MSPLFGKDDKKDKKPKKKEKKSSTGWDEEEQDEKLKAEGLKRQDMDEGRVELVDKDTSTPVIETYDEDTGELEGSILLKNGNRKGLLALVKILEEVNVEQNHEAEINSLKFEGKLNVENPSSKDRIWDIDLSLDNIESTTLKKSNIKIRELGTDEDSNVESEEFELSGEAKSLLLVKEYINTLPDADNRLNYRDIENDLLKLKEKRVTPEAKSDWNEDEDDEEEDEGDEDEDDETWGDGGTATEEYSLESYAIPIEKENTVYFAVAMRSIFEKPINNVKLVKQIPEYFDNINIKDTTIGDANTKGNELIWTIESLDPEETVLLKFTGDIMVDSIESKKTGDIKVTYEGKSSFAEGLKIDKFDAYTRNKFYVDTIERDEEPSVWDCKLVFENTSEFIIQLLNADVYSPEDKTKKFVDIDPNDIPPLPAGAKWYSKPWKYESEDFPSFRKLLEFRVVPDFQTHVNGTLSISDVELSVASIKGDVVYSLKEGIPEREEEVIESDIENIINVPTFKKKDIYASLKIVNDGSAPLNEIKISHQEFSEEFKPPESDEVKLLWDGNEIDLSSEAVFIDDDELRIEISDLKDSSTGMFEPESELEIQYPIHCTNPIRDSRFESDITYMANTYPLSQELEYKPIAPIIEAIHLRRKFRIAKEVIHSGDLGTYDIILSIENIGDMTLENLILLDKVPDSFEYGDYSLQPEITDEVGEDTLKWTIKELEPGEKLEITYEINGKGEYHPSDAQLAF